jgi:dTDP-4-amino-4,6-dideoxygalactose transaminase
MVHWLAKLLGLMNSPIEASCRPVPMPNALAALAASQLGLLEKISLHRKKIALLYNEVLNSKLKIIFRKDILAGANLRYPIWVNNRDELEEKLKKHGGYLLDHWYDAPVSEAGSCPNAEKLSKHIFNLPTHVNISLNRAKELIALINRYAEII